MTKAPGARQGAHALVNMLIHYYCTQKAHSSLLLQSRAQRRQSLDLRDLGRLSHFHWRRPHASRSTAPLRPRASLLQIAQDFPDRSASPLCAPVQLRPAARRRRRRRVCVHAIACTRPRSPPCSRLRPARRPRHVARPSLLAKPRIGPRRSATQSAGCARFGAACRPRWRASCPLRMTSTAAGPRVPATLR